MNRWQKTAKTGPNQKVRIAHCERFNWLSSKIKTKPLGGLPPIGQLKQVGQSLHFWARNHKVRFGRPLYLAKYVSFGFCCCLGALWVMCMFFFRQIVKHNYVDGWVNLLCLFVLFFEYAQVFLYFWINFCQQVFRLTTCQMLGHMGLINRDICLVFCCLICLVCFAKLLGGFIWFNNFFHSSDYLHFCYCDRCVLAAGITLIGTYPRARYSNERAGMLINVFGWICLIVCEHLLLA